jgi:alpha/beta superfamily hydrolase
VSRASEQPVFFTAGPLRLEGRLCLVPGQDAVVITHPHPLYGGDLDNPVVAVLTAAYQRRGYSTLRFNFRGVGASGGHYADGQGEQDDVRAAATYLAGLGKTVSDLAGYSFGAWVNLSLNPPLATVRRQLLVAPPVGFLEFGAVTVPPDLIVVAGDRDDFAPLALLQELLPVWQPAARLHVLPGVDHFYWNALDRLAALVEAVLTPPPG